MKVKALTGFAAMVEDQMVSHGPGDVFELPPGADWLRAGLVTPVDSAPAPEPQTDQIGPADPDLEPEPAPAPTKTGRKKKGS